MELVHSELESRTSLTQSEPVAIRASEAFETVRRTAPSSATAKWLLSAGRAREAFEQLVEFPVSDGELYVEVGRALAANGDTALSYEALLSACEKDLQDGGWFRELADLNAARALEDFERCYRGYPLLEDQTLADVNPDYAYCLHAAGHWKRAAEALGDPAQYVDNPTRRCVAWNVRGEDWEWEAWCKGKPEEVREILRTILSAPAHFVASPSGSFAIDRLVQLELEQGRIEAAREALDDYIQAIPVDVVRIAQLESKLGHDGAWTRVESHLHRNPDDEDAALALAREYSRTGRIAEARELRVRALETHGTTEAIREELLSSPDSYEDVLNEYRARLETRPITDDLDEQLGNLADVYRELGQVDVAVQLYQGARNLDPQDGEWWGALAAEVVPE